MRVRSTNGVTVAVHDLGGTGPPLLISHATGFCGRAYDPLAAVLRADFHVAAVDLRGHGDSTSPADGDFAWSGMAEDIVAAAGALGWEAFIGLGHSMGAAALLLAEAARPGLLRAAYLYEPIVLDMGATMSPTENVMAGPARRRRTRFASKAEVLRRYAARPPLNVLRADALAAYVEHGFRELSDGTVELKCSGEDEARTFNAAMRMNRDAINGLPMPASVAIGARAREPNPARLAPGVVARLKAARLLVYPHLGHFGPFQDPETVAADVVDLARRTGA